MDTRFDLKKKALYIIMKEKQVSVLMKDKTSIKIQNRKMLLDFIDKYYEQIEDIE